MACYDQTSCSVDPITGALTINTKKGSCTITPGSDVSFTETSVGYIITIDGVPHIIPKPDEADYGDKVNFTETEDEYIITINNVPFVIPKCRQYRDCNGDQLDVCERIVTCDHLDDVLDDIEDAISGLGPQTFITNGTGSQTSQNTYNVDHRGTIPNEIIRTSWAERDGDIFIGHMWNPINNEWDTFAIESAENLVVLNNPVIYLRKETGQANPHIERQDDLTEANAFNSFAAIRNFLTRTLLVGNITIDARGDFASDPTAQGIGTLSLSNYKGAGQLIIRGDANDPENLIIPWGGIGAGRNVGVSCTTATAFLRNMTFFGLDEQLAGNVNWTAATYSNGGNLYLGNTIKYAGKYNRERANAHQAAFLNRSEINGNIYIDENTRLIYDFEDGSNLSAAFYATGPSMISQIGNIVYEIMRGAYFADFYYAAPQSYFRFATGVTAPNSIAVEGSGRNTADLLFNMFPLAYTTISGEYGGRASFINSYDFGVDAVGGGRAPVSIDAMAVVGSVAGP